jgi:hypothetical protein
MLPLISLGWIGPMQPATLMLFGSTSTLTSVTVAFGAPTTGIPARLPAVFVTLAATQQFLLEVAGSTIYHQPPSAVLPTIWEEAPTLNPLRTIQPVLGPRRQLTATSLGNATGTVGVEVVVGGAVMEGSGVCVGVAVDRDRVAVGSRDKVGVSVIGTLDGRLQADRTSTRTNIVNKLRDFILSPLIGSLSYTEISRMATPPAVALINRFQLKQNPSRENARISAKF